MEELMPNTPNPFRFKEDNKDMFKYLNIKPTNSILQPQRNAPNPQIIVTPQEEEKRNSLFTSDPNNKSLVFDTNEENCEHSTSVSLNFRKGRGKSASVFFAYVILFLKRQRKRKELQQPLCGKKSHGGYPNLFDTPFKTRKSKRISCNIFSVIANYQRKACENASTLSQANANSFHDQEDPYWETPGGKEEEEADKANFEEEGIQALNQRRKDRQPVSSNVGKLY